MPLPKGLRALPVERHHEESVRIRQALPARAC
jgi:hypothetical protein